MPKDILDIVDTAIKIGLGATISGVTAYFVGRSNHKSEKQKFLLDHKLKLIESISEDVEEYFKAWSRFIGMAAGIEKNKTDESRTYTKPQLDSLKEKDADLVSSWQNRDLAVSKLRLLNANQTLESLREFSAIEKSFRDLIVFEKVAPDYDTIDSTRTKAVEIKRQFHTNLAKFYSQITT